ncbi:MAG: lytic transglycosylase domain-containing protein [Caulobacterales bacterium]
MTTLTVTLLLTGAVAFCASVDAQAEVLEIRADGSVVVYEGPTTRIGDQAQAIAPPAPPNRGRATATPSASTATYLAQAGAHQELSADLLEAVAYVESRFRNDAVSPRGARGTMQLMPATAAELGVDPNNEAQNIQGGALYLRQMLELFDGDITLALAAYNAGPAAVRRYGGVPPFTETQRYVAAVLDYMAQIAGPESGQ